MTEQDITRIKRKIQEGSKYIVRFQDGSTIRTIAVDTAYGSVTLAREKIAKEVGTGCLLEIRKYTDGGFRSIYQSEIFNEDKQKRQKEFDLMMNGAHRTFKDSNKH